MKGWYREKGRFHYGKDIENAIGIKWNRGWYKVQFFRWFISKRRQ